MFFSLLSVTMMACLVVYMYSVQTEPSAYFPTNVVVLHKNNSYQEVDMNGTRYEFSEDRKIDFLEKEWRKLYLVPYNNEVVFTGWTNEDAKNKQCEYTRNFIKEAIERCIGNVSNVSLIDTTFQEADTDGKLLIEFDYWYDNRFTGFIRYSLNLQRDPVFVSILDDKNVSRLYKLEIAENEERSSVPRIQKSRFLRVRL